MTTIVNYGLGNVRAIENIYKRLNCPVKMATTADDLRGAERIILPGVGAFDWAMEKLEASGMRNELEARVQDGGAHVLGICVGMQMLANSSAEGKRSGLGWVPGHVRRLVDGPCGLPHMGWNDLKVAVEPTATGLLQGLEQNARFYFLHSYFFDPADSSSAAGWSSYHGDFASVVRRGRVWGVQFHPEKSHSWGIKLLKNFAELTDA